MPSISTNPSKSQKNDLLAICRLGAVRLNAVAGSLEQRKATVKRSEFRRIISETFDDTHAAEAARRALPGLATAIRKFNISAISLFEMIESSLNGFSEQEMLSWHECQPIIQRIVSSGFVTLYAKARDLAFDFERLYARSRILTDIRPVFDDPRDTIVGANITQTLRLDYFTADSVTNSISVALDVSDIEQLRKACEEALRKAEAARALVERNPELNAVLPGESDQ
jgi:hypothetical protein